MANAVADSLLCRRRRILAIVDWHVVRVLLDVRLYVARPGTNTFKLFVVTDYNNNYCYVNDSHPTLQDLRNLSNDFAL